MKYLLFILAYVIQRVQAGMNVRIDTRHCTEDQKGGSDEAFAWRMKAYVEQCPQPEGYCVMENPVYPIKNHKNCATANKSIKHDIGWIWKFTFDDDEDANYEIEFGTDFGGGSAIFVDGAFESAFQKDFWWHHDWNDEGVFRMNYNFTAGTHEILVIGQEFCCDGDMVVRYSRNEQPKKELIPENWNCQQTNTCPVVCTDQQYKDGFLCKDCGYRCETCQESSDNCIACNDPNKRPNPPSCDCIDKYYDKPGSKFCQPCHSSCKTCTEGTSCETCENDEYLDTFCIKCTDTYGSLCGTCNNNRCKTCKNNSSYLLPRCTGTTCNSDEYKVFKTCVSCNVGCKTCVDNSACTSCENNEFLEMGECKSCETEYGSHCGTCNSSECLTCKNNASYVLPDCTGTTCGGGFLQDGQICRNCEAKCLLCSDSTTCTDCVDGYYLGGGDCTSCISECSLCSSSSNCTACVKPNFDPTSQCQSCNTGYFLTSTNDCGSCSAYYGTTCAECDDEKCTLCSNDASFTLPRCTSTECENQEYKDGLFCKPCIDNCLQCSDGTTCDLCEDLMYIGSDGTCQECTAPCLTCSDANTCTLCRELGYAAPTCTDCVKGFFSHNNECIKECPEALYGDLTDNTCKSCDNSCFDCKYNQYFCTICPNQKLLHEGKCVDCDDIYGMEQVPDAPKGTCREKCGDGILLDDSIHQCDDGNNISGDGCSADCKQENGWLCDTNYNGDVLDEDCKDKRPIGFKVEFFIKEQYLNVEEQAPLSCMMAFNKTFFLPPGTTLSNYLVISIEGKKLDGIKFKVDKKKKKRILNGEEAPPEYDIDIYMGETVKNRNIVVDLYPKSAFQDGSGNSLADEPPPKQEIKEYYYYSEEERVGTSRFEYWMGLGMLSLMLLMPFYVFLYKNHFNRFYVLYFVVDITQTLYFYRFLNVRWPINGIKFYRKLRPVIGFYMVNFYEQDIPEEDFETYSSGIDKFDKERESALFMNNTGHLLTLLYLYLFLYALIVLLTQKRLYCNNEKNIVYRVLWQFRFGYLEWGVWFDSMMASSGVFIIYIFLQMTNPLVSILDSSIALLVAVIYFGFFLTCLIYTHKNKEKLYTVERDEYQDSMETKEKMKINKTFKLRNIWHFIHMLDHNPNKSYFLFYFVLRKVYLAVILLLFQSMPKIQLLMSSFSHLVVIIGMVKWDFFKEKNETRRMVLSEFFVFIGLGFMYFLLDDESEDESYRFFWSWIVLGCLLMSLFIHAVFFLFQEILAPIYYLCVKKKSNTRVIDLRTLRKEGKIALPDGTINNISQMGVSQMAISQIGSSKQESSEPLPLYAPGTFNNKLSNHELESPDNHALMDSRDFEIRTPSDSQYSAQRRKTNFQKMATRRMSKIRPPQISSPIQITKEESDNSEKDLFAQQQQQNNYVRGDDKKMTKRGSMIMRNKAPTQQQATQSQFNSTAGARMSKRGSVVMQYFNQIGVTSENNIQGSSDSSPQNSDYGSTAISGFGDVNRKKAKSQFQQYKLDEFEED